jgi:thioredoxin 1
MSKVVHADDEASFSAEVLKASGPVVVDFWAPWCGPCKTVGPELDKLAAKYGDKIRIVKVDVDANPAVAKRYGVQGIPMIALFHSGEQIKAVVGARPAASLDSELGLSYFAAARPAG